MTIQLWLISAAAAFCVAGLSFHFFRLIRLGMPADFSIPAGNTGNAVIYSFTGAMSPQKKESAYLHLPTYLAGIIYHLGSFLALACIPFILLKDGHFSPFFLVPGCFLILSAACGAGMVVKRLLGKGLRQLSNPDDYISNLLVTLFQLASGVVLVLERMQAVYVIILIALLIYIPAGKLKHMLYFFYARIHLGYFFGRRGTWPPVNNMKE